jgi:hypothetical protein
MKKFLLLFCTFIFTLGLVGCAQKINGVPLADEKVFDNVRNRNFLGKEYVFSGCLDINQGCLFLDPSLNSKCTAATRQYCCFNLKNYGSALGINMDKIPDEQIKSLIEAGSGKYYLQIKGKIGAGSMQSQWDVEASEMEILQDCKLNLLKPNTGNLNVDNQKNIKPGVQVNINVYKK